MSNHVSWPQLPVIAIKLHAARALLDLGRPLEELLLDRTTRTAITRYNDQIRAYTPEELVPEAHRTDVEAPLETLFKLVGAAYLTERLSCNSVVGNSKSVVLTLARMSVLSVCTECLREVSTGKYCEWKRTTQSFDQGNLSVRGQCLEPVRTIFSSLVIELEGLCRSVGTLPPEVPKYQFEFRTAFTLVYNDDLQLAVRGRVGVSDGTRYVSLIFHPEKFWLADFLAIPYVIAHECVAHAFCGLDINDEGAAKSVGFHDGWMDLIAVYALKQCAESMRQSIPWWTDEFQERAKDIHRNRTTAHQRAIPSEDMIWWRRGVKAFGLLAEVWAFVLRESLPDSEAISRAEIDKELFVLSCRINSSSEVSHLKRRALVEVLYMQFNEKDFRRRTNLYSGTEVGGALVSAIQRYMVSHSAIEFVDAVISAPMRQVRAFKLSEIPPL